jgi:hypothetical protein
MSTPVRRGAVDCCQPPRTQAHQELVQADGTAREVVGLEFWVPRDDTAAVGEFGVENLRYATSARTRSMYAASVTTGPVWDPRSRTNKGR